jgi:hypothetical protein
VSLPLARFTIPERHAEVIARGLVAPIRGVTLAQLVLARLGGLDAGKIILAQFLIPLLELCRLGRETPIRRIDNQRGPPTRVPSRQEHP